MVKTSHGATSKRLAEVLVALDSKALQVLPLTVVNLLLPLLELLSTGLSVKMLMTKAPLLLSPSQCSELLMTATTGTSAHTESLLWSSLVLVMLRAISQALLATLVQQALDPTSGHLNF